MGLLPRGAAAMCLAMGVADLALLPLCGTARLRLMLARVGGALAMP